LFHSDQPKRPELLPGRTQPRSLTATLEVGAPPEGRLHEARRRRVQFERGSWKSAHLRVSREIRPRILKHDVTNSVRAAVVGDGFLPCRENDAARILEVGLTAHRSKVVQQNSPIRHHVEEMSP
jgi:hypothetical protein